MTDERIPTTVGVLREWIKDFPDECECNVTDLIIVKEPGGMHLQFDNSGDCS